MAISALAYLTGNNAADLNTKIAAAITASQYPVGSLAVTPTTIYPALFALSIAVATGATAFTVVQVLESDSLTDLTNQVTTAIGAGNLPIGGIIAVPKLDGGWNGQSLTKAKYYQLVGH